MKTTAKDDVRALLEKLPDDASLNDIQYHIYVRQKIERGLEAIRKETSSRTKRSRSGWPDGSRSSLD